ALGGADADPAALPQQERDHVGGREILDEAPAHLIEALMEEPARQVLVAQNCRGGQASADQPVVIGGDEFPNRRQWRGLGRYDASAVQVVHQWPEAALPGTASTAGGAGAPEGLDQLPVQPRGGTIDVGHPPTEMAHLVSRAAPG